MLKWIRHTGGLVLGWLLVVGGIILMPLPGPGTLVMVAGVAFLAPHYHWARRVLHPLRTRAVIGAKRGVENKRRVISGALVALWFIGTGVLWLVSPPIPEFSVLGLDLGPRLPGGPAAGAGLLTSGIVAAGLLVYSVKRWYPRSAGSDR